MRKALLAMILGLGACTAYGNAKVEVETLVKSSKSWDNKPLPAYPKGKPELRILKITIPAKTKLPLHQHPVINAGVLLSGELIVHSKSGEMLSLTAGDPIIEVVDKWHYGENQGDVPATIIVFYAGVENMPITVTH